MAGTLDRIGEWNRVLSRSTGKYYYNKGSESLWEDKSLPHGWGWKKASETSPKIYVNLISGEQSGEFPKFPAVGQGQKRGRDEAFLEPALNNTSILEQELMKYFQVPTISSLIVAGRGKRSTVFRGNKSLTSSGEDGLRETEIGSSKFTLKVQPFDERVAEEIEALSDASRIRERHNLLLKSIPMSSSVMAHSDDLSKLSWASLTPLVFPVHSFIDSSKNYYIIMEDFGIALDTNERLSWENAQVVFFRLMLALKYLHDQNRLHCDVHAGNILVTNNDYSTAVLVDLGSSQKIDKATRLYVGPTRGGRWDIMPPEQFSAGKGSVDVELSCASDIYSAAATFVQLISGSPPFAPPRGGKLTLFACKGHELRSIDAMKKNILSLAPHTVDMKLVDVLLRSLHPDRKQRFEKVEDVFESLSISLPKERS